MTKIYAKHLPYGDGHLEEVRAEMELAGVPTIRCIRYKGEIFALEGSHRLALAHSQGIIPKIFIMNDDAAGTCEEFYDRVIPTLPVYNFPYVLALSEDDFGILMRQR